MIKILTTTTIVMALSTSIMWGQSEHPVVPQSKEFRGALEFGGTVPAETESVALVDATAQVDHTSQVASTIADHTMLVVKQFDTATERGHQIIDRIQLNIVDLDKGEIEIQAIADNLTQARLLLDQSNSIIRLTDVVLRDITAQQSVSTVHVRTTILGAKHALQQAKLQIIDAYTIIRIIVADIKKLQTPHSLSE